MSDKFDTLLLQYPSLTREVRRGAGVAQFARFDAELARCFASHAYVIPFINAENCLVTRRHNGQWTLPGGTLEIGEDWLTALHRELWEETGAQIVALQPIGLYDCLSAAAAPPRPYLPHPRSVRVVCWANVTLADDRPAPSPGDDIAKVQIMHYQAAAQLFGLEYQDFAALYQLAQAMGS